MVLTVAIANRQAQGAVEGHLDLGPLSVFARSGYCDETGRRRPKWAATHVRTRVFPTVMARDVCELAEQALAALPGARGTGTFPGDDRRELRPYAWVIRDSSADVPTQPIHEAVTQRPVRHRGHVHTCICGQRFSGRVDARHCSNACRQRAYRERGGDA